MTHGYNRPPLLLVEDDGVSFSLWDKVIYTGSQGDSWTIPEGFRTDFATIPAAVSWAVPKLGAYSLAAIVHDLLCEGLNDWHRDMARYREAVRTLPGSMWPSRPEKTTANAIDTDAIFYKIARDHGTDPVTAALLWTGVRWGALANPARREGFLRRDVFWKWLGLSLAFAPVLLPATVLAVAGRVTLRAARFVARLAHKEPSP